MAEMVMNSSTTAKLNAINRRFYRQYHQAFAASRSRPWSGWHRAVEPFLIHSTTGRDSGVTSSILDVGCGNGRFALFLHSLQRGSWRYLGVDHSPEMIRLASQRLKDAPGLDARLQLRELVGDVRGLDLPGRPFDLVVMFGILHHVPGLDHRRRLIGRIARDLAPGGFLILSFWQFGNKPRFQRRILDWSEYNRPDGETIDLEQLESGDFLLVWGDQDDSATQADLDPAARRYCHFTDPEEAADLVASTGLRTVDRFSADGNSGDLNLYFVLQSAV